MSACRQSADRFFGELFFTITLPLRLVIDLHDSGCHEVGKTSSLVALITKNKPYPCPSKFGDIDYCLPSITRYKNLALVLKYGDTQSGTWRLSMYKENVSSPTSSSTVLFTPFFRATSSTISFSLMISVKAESLTLTLL